MILLAYYLGTVICVETHCRVYPQPFLLAFHFYAVALYSIFILFRQESILSLPRTILKSIEVLIKACIVFIPVVISELLP
jgi:squalene monooxygenase